MTGRRPGSAAFRRDGVISHPDKVFWPVEKYTKRDLIRFYDEVFTVMKPYVRDRILVLERCPDGMNGDCFYQKEKPPSLPPTTPTVRIRHADHDVHYVVGGRRETQLALANLGCIAVHVWGARSQSPRQPDWVCFDLDPPKRFADAVRAALLLKEALDELGLTSFPKTSGSRGLHVFVPIRRGPSTEETTAFAVVIGERLAAAHPKLLTVESRTAKRGGRVYLDAYRNAFAQTVVAPYSVRRRPKAPVSTPLAWSEVTESLDPTQFTIATFKERLKQPDPWSGFFAQRQSLKAAARMGAPRRDDDEPRFPRRQGAIDTEPSSGRSPDEPPTRKR